MGHGCVLLQAMRLVNGQTRPSLKHKVHMPLTFHKALQGEAGSTSELHFHGNICLLENKEQGFLTSLPNMVPKIFTYLMLFS